MSQNEVLELKNIDKNYGRKQALFDVSFSIPKGTIIGLIGPNGAGKSTIMKSIVGLTNYNDGEILIDNQKLSNTNRKPLDNVGTMIEAPSLYGYLTGRQHLELYANSSTTKADIQKIMDETEITTFADKKAKNYSLGMKQRLGIAMTLLNHPKLLILDEPMNGLDPQSSHDLRNLLLKLAKSGISILISSHLLDELEKVADYYVVINHGHVIRKAPAADFLSSDHNFTQIKTDNDIKAKEVLENAGLQVNNEDGLQIPTGDGSLNKALVTLVDNQIKIIDINKTQTDLEATLLDELKN